jgi:hypothetical protein
MTKPLFTAKSNTISKAVYNEKERSLDITFRTGNAYRYYNVPSVLWKAFQLNIKSEDSAGSFFNEYIKNNFATEKVSEG